MAHVWRGQTTAVAIAVTILVAATPARVSAQPQRDDLATLQRLLERDPARAFDLAQRKFAQYKAKDDFEGMMAVVRSVMAASILRASTWRVSGSLSTKTGRAWWSRMTLTVAMKV